MMNWHMDPTQKFIWSICLSLFSFQFYLELHGARKQTNKRTNKQTVSPSPPTKLMFSSKLQGFTYFFLDVRIFPEFLMDFCPPRKTFTITSSLRVPRTSSGAMVRKAWSQQLLRVSMFFSWSREKSKKCVEGSQNRKLLISIQKCRCSNPQEILSTSPVWVRHEAPLILFQLARSYPLSVIPSQVLGLVNRNQLCWLYLCWYHLERAANHLLWIKTLWYSSKSLTDSS